MTPSVVVTVEGGMVDECMNDGGLLMRGYQSRTR